MKSLLVAFWLAVAVPTGLMLSGCPASNPIQQAETLDQKALATYGSYVIVKEQAAKLYVDPVTPPEIAESLKAANDAASGPFDLLYQSMVAYKQTQEALEFGTATEADMQRAAEALLTLYLEAGPALQKLEDAVEKVRK